jgi:hypothetical protein
MPRPAPHPPLPRARRLFLPLALSSGRYFAMALNFLELKN